MAEANSRANAGVAQGWAGSSVVRRRTDSEAGCRRSDSAVVHGGRWGASGLQRGSRYPSGWRHNGEGGEGGSRHRGAREAGRGKVDSWARRRCWEGLWSRIHGVSCSSQ